MKIDRDLYKKAFYLVCAIALAYIVVWLFLWMFPIPCNAVPEAIMGPGLIPG